MTMSHLCRGFLGLDFQLDRARGEVDTVANLKMMKNLIRKIRKQLIFIMTVFFKIQVLLRSCRILTRLQLGKMLVAIADKIYF